MCEILGCKAGLPPLGLITMAGMLPSDWQLKLLDENCEPLSDEDLDWADLVMTGGMITQQKATLEVIRRTRAAGKPVVIGGPDPTSQPDIYADADWLVLDEGEITVPYFLDAWEAGQRAGVIRAGGKRPAMTDSPPPRFELVRLADYMRPSLQISRGCPYLCEFCDIIELYGRVPRVKSADQVIGELDALYQMGYRGSVEVVDDNFIGHRKAIKPLVSRIIEWQKQHGYPYWFATEATITLAQDDELMGLMREAGFRRVFIGVETPDPELLRLTQKKQNTQASPVDSIRKINESGMMVLAGFILGFDGERPGAADITVDFIEQANIAITMFGLLTCLPNTQLYDRLGRERRLLHRGGNIVQQAEEFDQMTGGLNFVPSRDRAEIYREYRAALERLVSPQSYFARIRGFLRWYRPNRHVNSSEPPLRGVVLLARVGAALARQPSVFLQFVRTLAAGARHGRDGIQWAGMLSAFYLHFDYQSRHVIDQVGQRIRDAEELGEEGFHRKHGFQLEPPRYAPEPVLDGEQIVGSITVVASSEETGAELTAAAQESKRGV